MGMSVLGIVYFITGLVLGTGNTILCKAIFTTSSVNSEGVLRAFDKPWFNCFCMFVGMLVVPALYIAVLWVWEKLTRTPSTKSEREGLLKPYGGIWEEVTRGLTPSMALTLATPAIIDLVASYFDALSLIYISASLCTILRGVSVVFTAFAKVVFLRQHLSRTKWVGVIVLTVSMAISGLSGVMPSPTTTASDDMPGGLGNVVFGIIFMMISAFVQSLGFVLIEHVIGDEDELGVHPLTITILQGFWGVVVMLVVVFPITQFLIGGSDVGGCMESFVDSLVMLQNSPKLAAITLVFIFVVGFFNVVSVYVIQVLDALWNSIMCNARPATVWLTDLLAYYFVSKSIGWAEAWAPQSWLQLAGLMVMFLGIAFYGEFLSSPCLEEKGVSSSSINNDMDLTSPALHSPTVTRVRRKSVSSPRGKHML